MWFPNGCNTNSPVQSQKQARSLKFRFKKRDCTTCIVKAKALISCAVTVPKMFSHLQNVGFLMTGLTHIYNVGSSNIIINIGV